MNDFIFSIAVIAIGAGLVAPFVGRFRGREANMLWIGFIAHVICVPPNIWIQEWYGGGDQSGYAFYGDLMAQGMERDFAFNAPEVLKLLFHMDALTPSEVYGGGHSTGSMMALGAILMFVTQHSLYASCMVVAVLAYVGQLCIYVELRSHFPKELHSRLLIASLLLPSVVFWTSGIIKEAFAIAALGPLFLGIGMLVKRRPLGLVLVIPAVVFLALVKAYVLSAAVLAAAAWIMWARAARGGRTVRLRPINVVLGLVVATGGIVALGYLFPDYSISQVSETATQTARAYDMAANTVGESSAIDLEGRTRAGPAAQLAYAPVALFEALFRPFPWDVRNPAVAVNALETMTLLVFFFRGFFGRSRRFILAELSARPVLVFCAVFVATLGVAVGLATGNIGAMSRYRAPFVPFFGALILVLSYRPRTVRATATIAPGPVLKSSRPAARLAPLAGARRT